MKSLNHEEKIKTIAAIYISKIYDENLKNEILN